MCREKIVRTRRPEEKGQARPTSEKRRDVNWVREDDEA